MIPVEGGEGGCQARDTLKRGHERARLQQELVANYLPDVGLRRSGQIIADAVIGIVPGAGQSFRPRLDVKALGEDGVAISFEHWLVAVNLAEKELEGEAFGSGLKLAPLGVTVQRMR